MSGIKVTVPRRIRARRGIYYRNTRTGRRYEITYVDSAGRQRWQVVAGGLREAQAARAEFATRLARGERLAPTRETLGDIAPRWLEGQTHLRRSTAERYAEMLRLHVIPTLGRIRAAAITEDDVADMILALRAKGLSAATVNKAVMVLGRVLAYSARRGIIASNPVARLERGERPSALRKEMRFLERREIAALLNASDRKYTVLLATAIFTGLRLGELLGLTWRDVDVDGGLVRVRKQLDRSGDRVSPKTPQAIREVVLMPALGRALAAHRATTPFDADSDAVFASRAGTPLRHRNASRRALGVAADRANLNGLGQPKLRFHDLRHTFASVLIAAGANVVFVSRQLGHVSPDITLRVYAHLFDRAAHAEHARELLQSGFGNLVERTSGE